MFMDGSRDSMKKTIQRALRSFMALSPDQKETLQKRLLHESRDLDWSSPSKAGKYVECYKKAIEHTEPLPVKKEKTRPCLRTLAALMGRLSLAVGYKQEGFI
jgi:hypothetical protein